MPPKKTIYTKLDQIDHCLKRPSMYIGSTSLRDSQEFVAILNDAEDGYTIIEKNIKVSPAILRIFIEILSNAVDNVERSKEQGIKPTTIKVSIDKSTGVTTIWNDGSVIPIEMHDTEKVYNHTLVFGQMLTGSNYDDDQERVTAGTNGLGANACNIFSRKFTVTGTDPENHKKIVQTWTNNMKTTDGPTISTISKTIKRGYTEVSWIPDFERFGLKKYSSDIISLYIKQAIDAAMTTGLPISINGITIRCPGMSKYSSLYALSPEVKSFSETTDYLFLKTSNCQIYIEPSDSFSQISFVNGIYTKRGGVHVDVWTEALLRPLLRKINGDDKKTANKKPKLNIRDIMQYFRIFVVATVVRPEFDSQSKEKLESYAKDQKPLEVVVEQKHINAISRWSYVTNQIENLIKSKDLAQIKKSEKKRVKVVEGLDPANKPGPDSILFICEGLSAKAYVVAGTEVGIFGMKGRKNIGIFPLTGKILNVRNATAATIAKNTVVMNIINSIGLETGVDYSLDVNFKKLRYGRVVMLTDADCFTHDTPIVVKINGVVDIIPIHKLAKEWHSDCGIIDTENTYIWGSNGWTPFWGIKRRKITKKILSINTYSGVVTCSEGHTMILEDGTHIKASELKIGDKLAQTRKQAKTEVTTDYSLEKLKSVFRELKISGITNKTKSELYNRIQTENNICNDLVINEIDNITPEEAWVWGFFFADGTCRTNYSWNISNNNLEYLETAKKILENLYPEHNYTIVKTSKQSNSYTHKQPYRLILNGGKSVNDHINIWRQKFYSDKYKKVPTEIFNSSTQVLQAFLEGYIIGDGDKFGNEHIDTNFAYKRTDSTRFDINGQIAAQGVCVILERLKYRYNIQKNSQCKSDEVYTVSITQKFLIRNPSEIREIVEQPYDHDYIYDIETEDHTVNAGIGQICSRQCDGIHIESLLLNLFHFLYPSILKRQKPAFFTSMKTPIVKVHLSGKKELMFYDEDRAKVEMSKLPKSAKIRYFKGLGTMNKTDVPETFGKKIVDYSMDANSTKNMTKIFDKNHSDSRKKWLLEYEGSTWSLDDQNSTCIMTISDYLNTQTIKFSLADCARSIPHLMDGLKESQRKILYFMLKKRSDRIKVAQLSGYVSAETNYHHGETSLQETIIGMAQDFVGKNNIPLLFGDGQFGSRLAMGSDAAAPRYIFTKLNDLTTKIFIPEDFPLLTQAYEDGEYVQPEFYVPIIPMVLVNGVTAGIGTGFSCNVPMHNPLDIINLVREWIVLDGDIYDRDPETNEIEDIMLSPIEPWYRNFTGSINRETATKTTTKGIINATNGKRVIIDEIPIGMSIEKFRTNCEKLLVEGKLKSIENNSTTDKARFELLPSSDFDCTIESLGLKSSVHTSNINLFNAKGLLEKYSDVYTLVDSFCKTRIEYYILRKEYQIKSLEDTIRILGNKERFIAQVISNKLQVMKRPENDIISDLESQEFDRQDGDYEYLLKISVKSFTAEQVQKIKNDLRGKQAQLETLKSIEPKDMWTYDLDELEKSYKSWFEKNPNTIKKLKKK